MSTFLTIAAIHLLGLASPGPDFAVIVQQSLSQPRRIVVWTAAGLGCGILLHVTYSLLGIGLIIAQSIVLYSMIKLLGAAYLIFIGWKALRSQPHGSKTDVPVQESNIMTPVQALRRGFLTNALNPKVTLFFLALFTQVIDPHTPMIVELFYGLYMAVATVTWFSILGSILTLERIRASLDVIHLWAERIMGAVLIALGVKVALSTRH